MFWPNLSIIAHILDFVNNYYMKTIFVIVVEARNMENPRGESGIFHVVMR